MAFPPPTCPVTHIHRVEKGAAEPLVRPDATLVFMNSTKHVYRSWVELLPKTAVPRDVTESIPGAAAAFHFLDRIISNQVIHSS